LIDETVQVRGGRRYETARSLAARGEPPLAVERWMRDSRINLIFEGLSEIMHLFMAREAVDRHLEVAGAFVDPRASTRDRIQAVGWVIGFYGWWYPTRWVGWACWPRERKQAFLFRAVDVAMELFALTAVVARAHRMGEAGDPEAASARRLADLFARGARRRVRALFREMWRNDDPRKYAAGREVLDGRHTWLEAGAMPLGVSAEELRPPSVREILGSRAAAIPRRGMLAAVRNFRRRAPG
jgi:hypothetical protein